MARTPEVRYPNGMTRLVTRRRLLSAAGLCAASTLLHVVVLRSLPEPASRIDAVRPKPASIDFEVGAPETSRAPEPPAAVPEAELPVPPSARQRAAHPEQPTGRRATAMRSEAARPEGGAAASAAPEAPTEAGPEFVESSAGRRPALPSPARTPDLDPRWAALGTLIDPARFGTGSASPDDLATVRGAELSAALKTLANDNPRRQRRTPALVHNADGTCSYTGAAISATILPDGGVRFDDKPLDVSLGLLQPLGAGGPEPPGLPMTPEDGVASPQRPVVKITGRAWAAERAWFLRETASMRAELADAAHARELAGAEHALRRQLDRIWCETSAPPASRRRELFTLWDNTSGDEVGGRGRRTIEQYLRENLPHGSPLAFPETQLAELNLHRTQRERFDPYGTGRDDSGGEPR